MPDAAPGANRLGLLEWATETRATLEAMSDEIGRAILVLLPIGLIAALILVLPLYYALHVRGRKDAAQAGEFMKLTLGVMGMFGSAAVVIVFVFTWPPAVEQLDVLTVKTIGLVGGVPMFIYAWREVVPRLFPTETRVPQGIEVTASDSESSPGVALPPQ